MRSDARLLALTLRSILLLYVAVAAFHIRFFPARFGIEGSWIFAINYFADKRIIFGRDVIFTYGPLGYILAPMNVGSNLDVAMAFEISLWLTFVVLMAYSAVKHQASASGLFAFLILFLLGWCLGRLVVLFDLTCFLALLLLCCSMFSGRWSLFYVPALFLSALLLLVRFSDAALSISSIVLFCVVAFLEDRRKGLEAAILAAVGIPLLFVCFYALYNPSLEDMAAYLRGAYEIASGYSVAMSLFGPRIGVHLASATFLVYFSLMFVLYRSKEPSFSLSVIFAPSLFVAFKHGFVRQDLHVFFFFSAASLIFGLILLFTRSGKVVWISLIPIASITLAAYTSQFPSASLLKQLAGLGSLQKMVETANYSDLKKALDRTSKRNLVVAKLPRSILNRVEAEPVGIFPFEISYVAANDLNYVPSPVFQTYSAYTPYLDRLNANHLENAAEAPNYILMGWGAIDGRHPLIDVPAMWLSMYRWYDVEHVAGSLILLRRRDVPRFSRLELIGRNDHRAGEHIDVPNWSVPIVAKISMRLNLKGKLAKFFFRIPQVRMTLSADDGRLLDFRVVPETLSDGLIINFLPMSLKDVEDLLKGKRGQRISRFRIYARGSDFYDGRITVEWYKIPDVRDFQGDRFERRHQG